MAGGRAVHVPLADDLHWDLDALTSALTGARMFVFCNPSNPTGIVHTRAELEALGDALDGTDTLVLTDEAYADLVFTSAPFVSALEVPSLAERTIYCQTFSKSYAMTGWRLGYLWGPPAVIEAAGRVHASFMGSPSTFVQRAGLVALSDCADEVAGMREAYRRRQRLMATNFAWSPACRCRRPKAPSISFLATTPRSARSNWSAICAAMALPFGQEQSSENMVNTTCACLAPPVTNTSSPECTGLPMH